MANYRKQTRIAARRYGLDPSIFERQIGAESNFDPTIRSPAGAIGIAQFMPGTAAGLGVNPLHPIEALNAAAKLMAGYVHKYGSYRNALVAYNAGPGAVGGPLPGETQAYVAKILQGQNPSGLRAPVRAPRRSLKSVSVTSATRAPAVQGLSVPPADMSALTALLTQAEPQQQSYPTPLAAPSFSSERYLSASNLQLPYTQMPQSTDNGLAAKLAAIGSLTSDAQLTAPQNPSTRTRVNVTTTQAPKGHPAQVTKIRGVARFGDTPVAGWIDPILQYARQHGWKGTVTSGYRSRADQARIYNSGVRPAARPGTSNHEFTAFPGGAVDVSNAAQLSAILRRSPYAKLLVWAGSKDPVHFSHPHSGGY